MPTRIWLGFVTASVSALTITDAVLNKTAKDHCAGTNCASMMDLARTIFKKGSSGLTMYVEAMVAALILMAMASILIGAAGTFMGDRGGLQRMAGGAFGLVAVIVVFGFVL